MQKLNLPKHLIEQAGLKEEISKKEMPKEEVRKQELPKQEMSKQDDSTKKGQKNDMENQDNVSKIEIKSIEEFKEKLGNKSFTDDNVLKFNEALAKYLVGNKRMDKSKKQDTITQLNKFYNLVRLAAKKKKQGEMRVKLRLIKAQITFAKGRGIISKEIKEFFDVSIEHILRSSISSNDEEFKTSLQEFVTFFESVYAYFYYEYHK